MKLFSSRKMHFIITTLTVLIFLVTFLFSQFYKTENIIDMVDNNPVNEDPVLAYLEENVRPRIFDNGKIFSSYKIIGEDEHHIYLWAYFQENHGYNAGYSSLVLKVLRTKSGIIVTGHQVPRDGGLQKSDIEKLFPKNLQQRVISIPQSDLEFLKEQTEERSNQWFALNQ